MSHVFSVAELCSAVKKLKDSDKLLLNEQLNSLLLKKGGSIDESGKYVRDIKHDKTDG